MRFEYPTQAQLPQLKALWKEAFGDPDDFIDLFFETAYSPSRCRCVWKQDALAGALYWFVCDLQGQKIAYLYAVATAESFRGQGVCRRLMADTHELLQKEGFSGSVLVPADTGLRQMYGKMGYTDFGGMTEVELLASQSAATVTRLSLEQYRLLRRKYLPDGGVLQEGENLSYLAAFCQLYGGEGFLLAGNREGEVFHAMEYLGDIQIASGVLTALGCEKGFFRMPGEKPFAMFRPLKEMLPPAYFGLDFS